MTLHVAKEKHAQILFYASANACYAEKLANQNHALKVLSAESLHGKNCNQPGPDVVRTHVPRVWHVHFKPRDDNEMGFANQRIEGFMTRRSCENLIINVQYTVWEELYPSIH
ncbi:unnamed protein product [Peronospora belbahrii]|uniref:Uncharacterized protein n=1 Tax=Peronospora belbahrii TaxID=622444 RepID=A0AAU9KQF0_9STRA|nr:unnamed protein product [Peronospora belbahrii]